MATFYVNATHDVTAADADLTLREAILAANVAPGADIIDLSGLASNSVIVLTQGEIPITDELDILGGDGNGLIISGDALGNDTKDAVQPAITDIENTGMLFLADNSRIFNISGGADTVVLYDMTLTGGYSASGPGGAIFAKAPDLTVGIEDTDIRGNGTYGQDNFGGGIYVDGNFFMNGKVTFGIDGNTTSGEGARGGGAYIDGNVILANESRIAANTTYGDYADGGGLFVSGELNIFSGQNRFENNRTVGNYSDGGGLYHTGSAGTSTITDAYFTGNRTEGNYSDGGGLSSIGTIGLTNTILRGNETTGDSSDGAGASIATGTIDGSTIENNRTFGASATGGGVEGQSLTINTSRIANNETFGNNASGGGISAQNYNGNTLVVTESEIVGNSTQGANARGGGIYGSGAVELARSLVESNSTTGNYSDGGGLHSRGFLGFDNTFWGNSTAGNNATGGAIYSRDGVYIGDTTITNNATNGIGFGGGGIFFSGTGTLTGSIVLGNRVLAPDEDPQEISGAINFVGANIVGSSTVAFDASVSPNVENAIVEDVFMNSGATNGVLYGSIGNFGGARRSVELFASPNNPALDRTGDLGALAIDGRELPRSVDQAPVAHTGTNFTDLGSAELQAGVNFAPDAQDDNANTPQNVSVLIDVLSNDSDPEGTQLVIDGIVFQPSSGTAQIEAGQIRYTPNQGFTGADLFRYEVEDADGFADFATVNITVDPPANSAPVAVDDAGTTTQDTPVVIDVLANDTDADGDILSITGFVTPVGTQAIITAGDGVQFTPAAGFTGVVSFDYQISDGNGGADTGNVQVTVNAPQNADPVAVDDNANVDENSSVLISVLANDSDADGDPLSLLNVVQPGNGTAAIEGDQVRYTPSQGFTGADSFFYNISDGNGGTDTGQVDVTVNAIGGGGNAAPVANDDVSSTPQDTDVLISVLGNDTDADGDPISITGTSAALSGTVTIEGDQIRYSPNLGFTGNDSFTYDITDGEGGDTGQVNITVTQPGQVPPVANDDALTTNQFEPIFSFDPRSNDTDANGDPLTVINPGQTTGGRTFDNGDGTLAYAPLPGFTGVDSFEYTLEDGQGGSDTGQISITVEDLAERIVCARVVAYLYEATFDRFPDLPGVNFWIDAVLGELPGQAAPFSKVEIAEFFLDAPEFEALFGDVDSLTDQQLVEQLFLNTLDRVGDPAGVAFWVNVLATVPGFTRADMLLAFAQSPENQLGSPNIVTLEETSPSEWEFI